VTRTEISKNRILRMRRICFDLLWCCVGDSRARRPCVFRWSQMHKFSVLHSTRSF